MRLNCQRCVIAVGLRAFFYTALPLACVSMSGCELIQSQTLTSGPVPSGTPSTAGYYTLPHTLLKVERKCAATGGCEPVSITTVEILDPSSTYSLGFAYSIAANDDLKVELDETGFLKRISSISEDKTLDIAKTIAATIISATTGVPAPALGFQSLEKGKTPFVLLIEPTQPLDTWKNKLRDDYSVTDFDAQPVYRPVTGDKSGTTETKGLNGGDQGASVHPDCSAAICYRVPQPYLVTADHIQNAVLVYGVGPLFSLSIPRKFGVKVSTTIDFTKGVPTSVVGTKPSELFAFVKLPYDLVQAIIALPTQLIQLRIGSTTKEKELADAQASLLNARTTYVEDVVKLLAAQRTLSANSMAAQGQDLNMQKELLGKKNELLTAQNSLISVCAAILEPKTPEQKHLCDAASKK